MHMFLNGPILVIGAHPDDMELMAGGLVARAVSEGVEVYSMVVSNGCENGDVAIRKREALRAAKVLGVSECRFFDVSDGRVGHTIELVREVEGFMREVNPAAIITHSDKDTHQDHKNVCYATLSAARRKPGVVLLGETPSSHFQDGLVYFDISNTMNSKIKALKAYKSQIDHGPINIDNVKMLAAYRGHKVGAKYAEAFQNWRLVL